MAKTRIKVDDRMYDVGFDIFRDTQGQMHYQAWYNHFKAEGTDLNKVVASFRTHIQDKSALEVEVR